MNLLSQDVIDPRPLFNKDTLSVFDRIDNKFITGWNWGTAGAKLDNAMNINTYHSMELDTNITTNYPDSMNVIQSFGSIIAAGVAMGKRTFLTYYL